MITANYSSSSNYLLPCEDTLRIIFSYLGDRKTLSSVSRVSKNFYALIHEVQRIRIICLSLLPVITAINTSIYRIYSSASKDGNRSKVTELPISLLDAKKTIPEIKKIPGLQITNYHLQCYQSCIHKSPDECLPYVFSHIKEDIIDALSDMMNKNMIFDLLTRSPYRPKYNFPFNTESICQGSDLDTLFSKARNRDVAKLFLQPTAAEFKEIGLFSLDYNGHVVDEEGEYCLVHKSYFGMNRPIELLCVKANIISARSKDSLEGSRLIFSDFSSVSYELALWIPVALLLGKQEGDILEFIYKQKQVRLRICQEEREGDISPCMQSILGTAIINSLDPHIYTKYSEISQSSTTTNGLYVYQKMIDDGSLNSFNSKEDRIKKQLLEQIYVDLPNKKSMKELAKERSFIESFQTCSEIDWLQEENACEEESICIGLKKRCVIL